MVEKYSSAKESLRQSMRERRTALKDKERAGLSALACSHVLASAVWREAAAVALYMAVRGEIDCGPLLENAWQSGKNVLLPSCSGLSAGHMLLLRCSGPEMLRKGAFSIPEPIPDEGSPGTGQERSIPDIIMVPGLAFDADGARLGMGGGYYDRLLGQPAYSTSLRIGFAYAFQIVEQLPRQSWDVPMHALCTEKGLIWIHSP